MLREDNTTSNPHQWKRWLVTVFVFFAIFTIIGCINNLLRKSWYWMLFIFLSFIVIALVELFCILLEYASRKNKYTETMDLFHQLSMRGIPHVQKLFKFRKPDLDYSRTQYIQSLLFLNRFSILEKGAGYALIGLIISSAIPAMKIIEEKNDLSIGTVFPTLAISILCFIVMDINNKLVRPNQIVDLMNFVIRHLKQGAIQEGDPQNWSSGRDIQQPLEQLKSQTEKEA